MRNLLYVCPGCHHYPMRFDGSRTHGDLFERFVTCPVCTRSYTFAAVPGERFATPTFRWLDAEDVVRFTPAQQAILWASKYEYVVVEPSVA